MKKIPENALRTTIIASSNDNNSAYSFSPSELYVDINGDCFEETYSSRENEGDSFEDAGRIENYFSSGYWNVSGEEIKERFDSFLTRIKSIY